MDKLEFDNKARRTVANCPCGRSNKDGKFCPYKGFENKGYCHSCGETFLPTIEKNDVNAWRKSDAHKMPLPNILEVADIEPSYINPITARQTMQRYEQNNFTQFLTATFENDEAIIRNLINRFSIGTAQNGATVFLQVDINGNVRSGQRIFYNPITGKRKKEMQINWIHSLLKLPNFNLKQCFFGEYQLRTDKNKTVAIVEAAKTAAIMTPIEPRYTWIATGGANGLTLEKCKVLQGFKIVSYPDLGKFESWLEIAAELKIKLKLDITVSDFLENYVSKLEAEQEAEQRKDGLDIADYAIKFNWYAQMKQQQIAQILPPSKAEQTVQAMQVKNPLLKKLISALNLVNAKTMQPLQSI